MTNQPACPATHDDGYRYDSGACSHAHAYLLPAVEAELATHFRDAAARVFDLGCGNGSVAHHLTQRKYSVTGVDPSGEGIRQANAAYPDIRLEVGSGYDNLTEKYGQFPAVISLEVIEHVYAPRAFAATLYALTEPGGMALISTPYHSYLKNLALAASGRMDGHFTALWDHGHIKFWSYKTLSTLLAEAGFVVARFQRVGRFPPLAKSMIAVAHRPRNS